MADLRINPNRLNTTLQETCDLHGPIPNSTGMCRLTLGTADKDIRDWLASECKKLECDVKVDQMGNMFATRKGKVEGPPIAMGSHLDTQPRGGRYDGILGVMSALEVLRTLNDHNITTNNPIALVNWTNEEGARFPGAMMASGVWSTHSINGLSDCHSLKDSESVTMQQALKDIGYLGDVPADYRQNGLKAHFELHIEQGPLLEREGKSVGIVTAVQAMKWFRVRVEGVEGHAGTQPMDTRSDALVTASRLIASVRDTATELDLGVATVGVIESDTHAQSTIPSGIEFIIDVRCSTDAMVADLEMAIFQEFDTIVKAERNKTSYRVLKTWGLPESVFHPDCIKAVRSSAEKEVGEKKTMDMKSKAGHDCAWTSRVCPGSMIFVPSKDGISHNPNEYTSPEHCAIGAQVLLQAVLSHDSTH